MMTRSRRSVLSVVLLSLVCAACVHAIDYSSLADVDAANVEFEEGAAPILYSISSNVNAVPAMGGPRIMAAGSADELACPVISSRLSVSSRVNEDGSTLSRLLWTPVQSPATAPLVRGLRWSDAHCQLDDGLQYNVRMMFDEQQGKFVADMPIQDGAHARCWFTYELELSNERTMQCDSTHAFAFTNALNANAHNAAAASSASGAEPNEQQQQQWQWQQRAGTKSPLSASTSFAYGAKQSEQVQKQFDTPLSTPSVKQDTAQQYTTATATTTAPQQQQQQIQSVKEIAPQQQKQVEQQQVKQQQYVKQQQKPFEQQQQQIQSVKEIAPQQQKQVEQQQVKQQQYVKQQQPQSTQQYEQLQAPASTTPCVKHRAHKHCSTKYLPVSIPQDQQQSIQSVKETVPQQQQTVNQIPVLQQQKQFEQQQQQIQSVKETVPQQQQFVKQQQTVSQIPVLQQQQEVKQQQQQYVKQQQVKQQQEDKQLPVQQQQAVKQQFVPQQQYLKQASQQISKQEHVATSANQISTAQLQQQAIKQAPLQQQQPALQSSSAQQLQSPAASSSEQNAYSSSAAANTNTRCSAAAAAAPSTCDNQATGIEMSADVLTCPAIQFKVYSNMVSDKLAKIWFVGEPQSTVPLVLLMWSTNAADANSWSHQPMTRVSANEHQIIIPIISEMSASSSAVSGVRETAAVQFFFQYTANVGDQRVQCDTQHYMMDTTGGAHVASAGAAIQLPRSMEADSTAVHVRSASGRNTCPLLNIKLNVDTNNKRVQATVSGAVQSGDRVDAIDYIILHYRATANSEPVNERMTQSSANTWALSGVSANAGDAVALWCTYSAVVNGDRLECNTNTVYTIF